MFQSLAYVHRGCQILAYGDDGAKYFGVTVYVGTHIFGLNPPCALCTPHLFTKMCFKYRPICISPRTPKNHEKTIFTRTFTETGEQFNSCNHTSHGSVSVVRTTFKVYEKRQTLTLSQPDRFTAATPKTLSNRLSSELLEATNPKIKFIDVFC